MNQARIYTDAHVNDEQKAIGIGFLIAKPRHGYVHGAVRIEDAPEILFEQEQPKNQLAELLAACIALEAEKVPLDAMLYSDTGFIVDYIKDPRNQPSNLRSNPFFQALSERLDDAIGNHLSVYARFANDKRATASNITRSIMKKVDNRSRYASGAKKTPKEIVVTTQTFFRNTEELQSPALAWPPIIQDPHDYPFGIEPG